MHNPLATSIMDPNTIHGPKAQKMVSQHCDRFWASPCFNDSCRLLTNLGLKPVPLEAPWNYLSIHIKNVWNGFRMRLGCYFWCGLLLDSEVDSNLSCFGPPPWGIDPDKLWAFFSTWKTLLVSFIFIPFTMFWLYAYLLYPHHPPLLERKVILGSNCTRSWSCMLLDRNVRGQENYFQLYPAKD